MRALKLLNQKGFTLPEVMIAAALLGGVALLTAKLMEDQGNNQAFIKNSAEIAATVTRVESLMNNPLYCKQMFAGNAVGTLTPDAPIVMGGVAGVAKDILGITTPSGAAIKVLGEWDYGSYSIPIDGLKLQRSVYGGSIVDLLITFNMKGGNKIARHRSQVIRKIPFIAKEVAGLITECGSVLKDAESVGQQKMCLSLGDAASWNGTKCTLNAVRCPFGQLATKLTSLGGIICEDIASQVNLSELFDASSVNCVGKPNVQIVNSLGKFKIICNP